MQRRTFLTLGLVGGAGLALAGCGFQLRGLNSPSAPMSELALAGSDSDLARRVEQRLVAAGTLVHDGADRILNLGRPDIRQRRVSVLESGPRDEEMRLVAPFSVQRADGAYLLDQQRLEISRRYSVDDGDLLGREERRDTVREELLEEAALQLIERLRGLS
ncbi:twin-arginine translocation signal domain-containing protein [Halomonas sp. KAO]|uniref:LPS-assembly lipoprotein LptE n=1 Tax=Halomonas sp. KAO TaxID=2783858 RepID=UPI00189E705D|nr:LPS assembly lipoprotein LptE [Halomonas sp. KAO]MBF7053172.1 twin-arginine translocation signal domain-containing protein [Halomonas sp. KAO]